MTNNILTQSAMTAIEQTFLPPDNSKLFQLLFLSIDAAQSVEVVETSTFDAEEVTKRVRRGKSVFITCKSRRQKLKRGKLPTEDHSESWYFTHI